MRRSYLFAFAALGLLFFVAACGSDDDDVGNVVDSDGDDIVDSGSTPADDDGAPTVSFAEACQKSDEKQFAEAPPRIIDTGKTYVATISTAKGDIVVELFSDTPITTNNFVFLACKGYYDGLTFHRVIEGFMAQGGDPTGTGSGGPGYSIPDEDDGDHTFETGVISMAKAGPDTTGSQFFITYTPQPSLETGFTVFGRVTSGMDAVEALTPRDPAQNPDAPPGDVMDSVTIEER